MSPVDHGHEIESAAPAEQIAIDGSVGSDTDTGGPLKADSLTKDGPDVQHHARSNSVKKPTTFKAVSVTKNFLAKAGTPAAPNPKVNGENATVMSNGAGTLPPAPRPRLVAKSASATKQSKSHFGPRNGGSGPDPMQVWNRNRAAPQQPPKHLTDEELKQQYGIHLATRIQADGDGKEAKWADIDDDEDDWAPETIEWNDGTKITLSQNDSAILLAEERASAEAAKAREEEQRRAKAVAQQKPTTIVGPNATVLKPRSTAQLKPSGGLVLKTPAEKPTLVSKPAAPAPTKSPWAPLPAIDKVPPVEINPPIQAPAPNVQENGVHPPAPTRPSPPPAMEIAADSFKRGQRDSQHDNGGRLYNAQSGNYEPANAARRGSVRKDANFRPPSVLQRGGSVPDGLGPAEPSPAFQIHRTTQDEQGQLERRKSSTISADSGPQDRSSHSTSKGSDYLDNRRGSQHSQAIQSPTASVAGPSPTLTHTQLPQGASSTTGLPYQARAGPPAGGPPNERPDVAQMKQIMKERRDLAIRRRKEQEEREEAEKKERIRKKMEELGLEPLPDKKEAAANEVQTKTIEKRPVEVAKLQKAEDEKRDLAAAAAAAKDIKQPPKSPSSASRSPPKPPAPNASGTPQQYGMIKVHSTSPRDGTQQINETLHMEKMRSLAKHQRISPPRLEPKAEAEKGESSPLFNGITTQKSGDYLFQRSPEMSSQQPVREARQQPWNNVTRDPYVGWNVQNVPREPNNVWGVSSQSRSLGNGTFDRTIQRPQSRQQDQYPSSALAPIGPPKHLQQHKDPREHGRSNNLSPAPAAEDSQTIPSFPPSEAPSTHRADTNELVVNGEQSASPPELAHGAQTGSQIMNQVQLPQAKDQRCSTIADWGSFQATSAREDAEKRRRLQQQHDARLAEEACTGVRHEPHLPIMNETWRQVKVDEKGVGRSIIGVSRAQNPHGLGTNIHAPVEIRGPPFMNSMDMASSIPSGLGRGSRFFPTAGRGLHTYHQTTAPFSPFHRRSDSPPPPDSLFHPAYSADPRRIMVRLPFENRVPKPKVRLPPSVVTPVQSPQLAHVQPLPMRAASQPLVNNPSWQDRFNGLLGVKKTSSEKSPEKRATQIVGFSATKEPLDLPARLQQAAVALPPQSESCGTAGLSVSSRDSQDEEALFEPESGSTPSVLFPPRLAQPAWATRKPLKRSQLKSLTPVIEVEVATMETLTLPDLFTRENLLLVFVKLMGMSDSKSRAMRPPPGYVRDRELSGAQGSLRQQNFTRSPKPQGKGFKSRESLGNFNHGPKTGHNGPQKSNSHISPRNYQRIATTQSRIMDRAQERQPAAWENIVAR
ncbi:MAG: hypothetical protein Q9217_003759 [Psora testacea]